MLPNVRLPNVRLSKVTTLIVLATLLFCFTAKAAETPCMALDEILPGMQCHGFSYFSPDGPERLELEVIGIVESTSRESAYILARVDSPSVRRGGNHVRNERIAGLLWRPPCRRHCSGVPVLTRTHLWNNSHQRDEAAG